MAKNPSRRNFLRTAPVAAAAGFTLADTLAAMAQGAAQAPAQGDPQQGVDLAAAAQPAKLWSGKDLDEAMKALDAKPGDNRLYASNSIPVQIVLTTEKHKSAPEFEWHEGRDHIVQVLDGATIYELGGKPEGAHNNKLLSEWLAPTSPGSTTLTLHKGDMLVIPRGTPHKRSTEASVTFYLISTTGK